MEKEEYLRIRRVKRMFREYPLNIAIKIALTMLLSRLSFLLPDKYFLINYHGGKIYLNLKESEMMIGRALGVYEYWKTRLFFDIVKEGMTCVDVGVNKGYFSLLFAKLMNDRGKVLSFEPDPDNCFWFKKSIQANNYECIKVYQCALSNNNGDTTFYPGRKSGWGSLFPSDAAALNKNPITVKTRRLDNILKEENISSVDIIKIDVEGSDLLVLKGAEKILKSGNVRLVMDIDVKSEEERRQLFEFLKSCGFQVFKIGKKLKPIEKIDEAIKEIYAIKKREK